MRFRRRIYPQSFWRPLMPTLPLMRDNAFAAIRASNRTCVMKIELHQETNAAEIFDHSFLDIRAKLLEIAAVLDRVDRASDDGEPLPRNPNDQRGKIDDAIRILLSEGPDRAARLQRLFSREYESDWRNKMQL